MVGRPHASQELRLSEVKIPLTVQLNFSFKDLKVKNIL